MWVLGVIVLVIVIVIVVVRGFQDSGLWESGFRGLFRALEVWLSLGFGAVGFMKHFRSP